MARYHATVESQSPAAGTFGYMAAFSNEADWDRVLAGQQLDRGTVGVGSRFRLVVRWYPDGSGGTGPARRGGKAAGRQAVTGLRHALDAALKCSNTPGRTKSWD